MTGQLVHYSSQGAGPCAGRPALAILAWIGQVGVADPKCLSEFMQCDEGGTAQALLEPAQALLADAGQERERESGQADEGTQPRMNIHRSERP